jgi:hypothetical protein
LKIQNCPGRYIDQTGRSFNGEHVHAIRTKNKKTGYSHHILNTGHSYGSLENSLEILNIQEKGPYPNTTENFYIYRTKQTGYLFNDIHANTYKPIFELLIDRSRPGSGSPDH